MGATHLPYAREEPAAGEGMPSGPPGALRQPRQEASLLRQRRRIARQARLLAPLIKDIPMRYTIVISRVQTATRHVRASSEEEASGQHPHGLQRTLDGLAARETTEQPPNPREPWPRHRYASRHATRILLPVRRERLTDALRGAQSLAAHALAAPIARRIAAVALIALVFRSLPFHDPFHDPGQQSSRGPRVVSFRSAGFRSASQVS
jgi:hypothetical protein